MCSLTLTIVPVLCRNHDVVHTGHEWTVSLIQKPSFDQRHRKQVNTPFRHCAFIFSHRRLNMSHFLYLSFNSHCLRLQDVRVWRLGSGRGVGEQTQRPWCRVDLYQLSLTVESGLVVLVLFVCLVNNDCSLWLVCFNRWMCITVPCIIILDHCVE